MFNEALQFLLKTIVDLFVLAALALGRWMLDGRPWMLGATSALVGMAGLVRWDFGAFGLIALAATVTG